MVIEYELGIVGLEPLTFAVQKEDCLYIFMSRGNGLLGAYSTQTAFPGARHTNRI